MCLDVMAGNPLEDAGGNSQGMSAPIKDACAAKMPPPPASGIFVGLVYDKL